MTQDISTTNGLDLIFKFCHTVDLGETPDREILVELASRLRETLGPVWIEADAALKIERKTGPKDQSKQIERALAVERLIREKKAKSVRAAAEMVAGKLDNRAAIEKNHKTHCKTVQKFLDVEPVILKGLKNME